MAVYPLHILTGLLGPVRRVSAFTARTRDRFDSDSGEIAVDVDDNWQILLDFGAAVLGWVYAGNCTISTRVPQLEIQGYAGTLTASLLDVSAPLHIQSAERGWETLDVPHERESCPDHILGIAHLADIILGIAHLADIVLDGAQPILTVDHALHVVEIIEKAARSSREGRVFDIEHTDF
jgi:predicted dehydrogenase